MHWELWDTESGSLVGDDEREAEAPAVVRDAVRRHGLTVVATLSLGAEHDDETGSDADLPPVIRGSEFATRVLDDAAGRVAGGP